MLIAGPSRLHAASVATPSPNPRAAILDVHVADPPGSIVVAVGKSQIVHFDRPFRQIEVGSKDVVGVVPLSATTIYLSGRKQGSTNITLQGAGDHALAVLDVVVSYDIDGLEQAIHALVPDAAVSIRPAGDALILSGQVANPGVVHQILEIADRYAPGKITNLLTVAGSQQVLLQVKFSEVQRTALHNLGVNSDWSLKIGNGSLETTTGNGVPATTFGTATAFLTGGAYKFSATLNALEKNGAVRTLAAPDLVALSGDSASFLAGGEFPIPVIQSLSGTVPTTTIEFKEFGVGLSFTPTIVDGDLINLEIKSEVSAIDQTISVEANGVQVPGLKVRRAKTAIELRDGQSFAIAGLLQDDFSDEMNQIPGLGSIPVLGALFRSTDYQHNRSELVVFITAHLVQPTKADAIATPTAESAPPSVASAFALGKTETSAPAPPAGASGDGGEGPKSP